MKKRNAIAVAAVTFEAIGWTLDRLGRTWGSTREERHRSLGSDDIVARPDLVTDHAITIAAPTSDVWPWLVQMGWARGGFYTYRWVDRLLFPANLPSSDVVLPEYQGLAVGDEVPDGDPSTGCHFVVEALERERMLVLRSHTHLPPRPRNAQMDWTWTYVLTPEGPYATRLHLRSRLWLRPKWLALAYRAGIGADFVMGRSHLRGIQQRAEALALKTSVAA